MKTHSVSLLLTLTFVTGSVFQALASNLLPNPGFEQGGTPPSPWQFQNPGVPEVTLEMDGSIVHGGVRSFKVTSTSTDPQQDAGIFVQNVAIPNDLLRYDFSFYTRLQNANRVWSALYWRGSNGVYIGQGTTNVITEYTGSPMTHDWEKQEAFGIVPPPGAASVDVFLYAQGSGTFWFDDVDLRVHTVAPFPLFPDLVPNRVLDREDLLSLSGHLAPGGANFTDFGHQNLHEFLRKYAGGEMLPEGLSFRDFFPLNDGDDFYYRSNDFPNNIDYFRRRTLAYETIRDMETFRIQIYDTPEDDRDARQSLVVTASGPVEIVRIIIDNEISSNGLVFPPQTINFNPGLVLAFPNVQVGDVETTTTSTTIPQVRYQTFSFNNVPATVTLESVVMDVRNSITLQDDAGTILSDTLILGSRINATVSVPFVGNLNFFLAPGSGIMWFVRGYGMVQLQEFTDPKTPGEIFPLRQATVGGVTFP